jgi:hypothetical protein
MRTSRFARESSELRAPHPCYAPVAGSANPARGGVALGGQPVSALALLPTDLGALEREQGEVRLADRLRPAESLLQRRAAERTASTTDTAQVRVAADIW